MAHSTTYSKLVLDLQRYCENDVTEFVNDIPNIIARAQDRVQADIDLSQWRTIFSDSLNFGSGTYSRDPSWLKILSIYIPDQGKFIERRTHDYVRTYQRKEGVPRYFSEDSESTISVGPKPSMNFNIEVEAHTRLPALSTANETNWIAKNAGDLLLWASLIEAEMFLMDQERIVDFQQMYQGRLQQIRFELRGVDREEKSPTRSAPVTGA